MPSGKAHRKLAVATVPLVVLGGWTIAGFPLIDGAWVDIGIVALGYLINPSALSPDMDLPQATANKAYGNASMLWWPYQALIHRGPFSHWPPLSSLLRVAYIWLALFVAGTLGVGILDLIYWGLFEEVLVSWDWVRTALGYWILVWTIPQLWQFIWGVTLGDIIHTGADISYSFMRK